MFIELNTYVLIYNIDIKMLAIKVNVTSMGTWHYHPHHQNLLMGMS